MEKTNPLNVAALDGIEYTQQDVDYFLCGAFEGGSNYWVDFYEKGISCREEIEFFWEAVTRNGTIFIYHGSEEGEENKTELTLPMLVQGLEMFFSKYFEKEKNKNKKLTFDFVDLDADDSDLFLQYSLFGEEVYC